MKSASLLTILIFVAGCSATHERPMNKAEKTIVSDKVAMMVEEEGGRLDIRDHEDVRCRRIKLTGSHMVTRLCYTKEEEWQADKDVQDKMRDRFAKIKCLDKTSAACQNGGN